MNNQKLTWFKSNYSSGEGGDCVEAAYAWFKSSHSSGGGGECVEASYTWHKSTHSDGEGGECLEVAACPHTIHIRDSKNPVGPNLTLSPAAWADFLAHATE
ncbi:DUF397 domain-containing protein [Streptomyces antibioticus]|uniref:DUF397 domain-containing protein n=1 Tax=Streptomyces antibioticus TaxID=1890 RepID=UPI0033BCA223